MHLRRVQITRLGCLRNCRLGLALLCTLSYLDCNSAQARPSPIDEVIASKDYRKAIGNTAKRINTTQVYTKKWFDPASFYGQLFLREDGYQTLFDWLAIPSGKFSPVTTTVKRKGEYLEVIRTYLDTESKAIALSILVPHPRSRTAIEQGLVPAFSQRIPKEIDIFKSSELMLAEKKATLYQLEDNSCSIVYRGAVGSLIEAKVESCKQKANLEQFMESLNLGLLDQRLQS